MRVVIQKVSEASVSVEKRKVAQINNGLLVLLGIEDTDTIKEIEWLCRKIVQLRIFLDENGVMNRSILDEEGEIIVVSQFTLFASIKKGNRPSYLKASNPEFAVPMYEKFCTQLSTDLSKPVQTGMFGTEMKVALINDGPVTIVIDTKNKE
ncbi:MAG: D-aminoacyl-tRNA deacylase [Prolixibacteraceae bacterium]